MYTYIVICVYIYISMCGVCVHLCSFGRRSSKDHDERINVSLVNIGFLISDKGTCLMYLYHRYMWWSCGKGGVLSSIVLFTVVEVRDQ